MTTSVTKELTSSIPTRDSIEDRHKWNLGDLYENDEKWESDFSSAKALMVKAADFSGKLGDNPATLYQCLCARTEVSRILSRLYMYAHLSKDLDNRVSKYQEMTERAAMLSTEAGAAFSFVEPELLQIDEARLIEITKQFEKTNVYDFYINDLIRSRSHIRSTEIEELLAQSTQMARGADTIFSMLNDADLTYPTIKDEKGNDVTLTKQRFAKFMESPDRRVRQDAYMGFYKVYQEHLNTTAAALAASVNNDVFYSRARRFDSCLHSALDGDNIPHDVYHSLYQTVEANIDALHDYVDLRGRILKLDTVRSWDTYCPLFPDCDYEVPYDEAVAEVLEAVKPLGAEYCSLLEKGFASRWVDVLETEGKTSGAFSAGATDVHPFVLMNYNNTVDNMFTLAHEMGHAMHSYLSDSKQPLPKAQYSIFVAEVASTLNEGLLLQHLLKKSSDERTRLYLLNRSIDNAWGTFVYQSLLAHFEQMIHEAVEKGSALSPETLNHLYGDLVKNYSGPAFEMDEYSAIKWSRIPHFYRMFYVFQYATSFSASQAILTKFVDGEKDIVSKYLTLLSSGGSDYPIELLKGCGIDMTTSAPTEATLKVLADQVSEMRKLVEG